ncbi:MAG TPA: polysaccharide deacetylase family protein [Clostridiaceae bacterium]|nr:polysaccharide deacetylase family protein [Clostridiaceae bacterium]
MKRIRITIKKIACLVFSLSLILNTFQISSASSEKQNSNITIDDKKAEIVLTSGDGALYVPAEKIYPLLGANYSWDSLNSRAVIQYGAKNFTISEQDNQININGRIIQLKNRPHLNNGVLMIPLISAVESVGGGLEWDEGSKTWKIYSWKLLENTVDIMGDGKLVQDRLAKYEKYFDDGKYKFWSSLRDGASLYRSDSDGNRSGRLIDTATEVIGMDSDYVYFIDISQGGFLYRIKKDGTDLKKLTDDAVESVWLDAERIKYHSKSSGLSLYSIAKDGSGKRTESTEITVINRDWVVNDNVSVSDKNILLKGNLVINRTGSLTLNNVNLLIDCGNVNLSPVERRIQADSSSITIRNSWIGSTHPDGGIFFSSVSSKVDIESSRISGIKDYILLDRCDNTRLIGNYIINSAENGVIKFTDSNRPLFKDNIIINKTRGAFPDTAIQAEFTKDASIMNNVFVDQGECILFTRQTTESCAANNLIFGDSAIQCLSLKQDAGNNIFYNNFIQLNYDDGYRITNGQDGIGILSDSVDNTSVFEKNVINNAANAVTIKNLKNCIYDSNRVWLQLTDNGNDRDGYRGLDMQYSHHCEIINNIFTSWPGKTASGIQLFYSTGSRIEGNILKGFKYGLELWNASDSNILSGNYIADSLSYIVTDRSNHNKVTKNSFISNKNIKTYAYNNGDNEWASNFYGGLSYQSQQTLVGTGSDKTPVSRPNELIKVRSEFERQKFIPQDTNDTEIKDYYINGNETWKDKSLSWQWRNVRVADGGTLTIENTTVKAPSTYDCEPYLIVENGGTLVLRNNRILADPFGMPIYISVSDGGKIIAENCTFEYLPAFDSTGSGSVVKNCRFDNCYAVNFYNSSNVTIENCNISNSYFGFLIGDCASGIISGNKEENIAVRLGEPAQVPVADNKTAGNDKNPNRNKKIAYITIDDGPTKSVTPTVLDTLKNYGVKATFFVLSRQGVDDLYKRIINEGHVIGNHSSSHDYNNLYKKSVEDFRNDVLKARNYISQKFNYTTTLYRFPGGSMSWGKDVIKAREEVLANLGYRYFDWNASTGDTDPNLKKYGTDEQIANLLANNILKNTKGKDKLIILMHDSAGKKYSAKALPIIIEGLREQGYEFDVLTNY